MNKEPFDELLERVRKGGGTLHGEKNAAHITFYEKSGVGPVSAKRNNFKNSGGIIKY
jgi:hypothetical protein